MPAASRGVSSFSSCVIECSLVAHLSVKCLDHPCTDRVQSIDLWQFTKRINQRCSDEEEISIIQMLWKIVYADGTLDKHERYLVHKLSGLLRLSHERLIDASLRVIRKVRAAAE